jgi:hypothetical protein
MTCWSDQSVPIVVGGEQFLIMSTCQGRSDIFFPASFPLVIGRTLMNFTTCSQRAKFGAVSRAVYPSRWPWYSFFLKPSQRSILGLVFPCPLNLLLKCGPQYGLHGQPPEIFYHYSGVPTIPCLNINFIAASPSSGKRPLNHL